MRRFIRARCEPAQRWGPAPKATWRLLPVEIERRRVRELAVVAVGRGPREQDLVALLDRAAADLGVAHGGAGDEGERSVEAQQLLDRSGDQLGPRAEQRRDLGLLAEPDHHHAERAGGGVEPAEEEQLDDADDLLLGDRAALDLGVQDGVDDVAAGARRRRFSAKSPIHSAC